MKVTGVVPTQLWFALTLGISWPARSRPSQPVGYEHGLSWSRWLVDDQREASGRPDVLAFVSDVLTAPVTISGQPIPTSSPPRAARTPTGWSS